MRDPLQELSLSGSGQSRAGSSSKLRQTSLFAFAGKSAAASSSSSPPPPSCASDEGYSTVAGCSSSPLGAAAVVAKDGQSGSSKRRRLDYSLHSEDKADDEEPSSSYRADLLLEARRAKLRARNMQASSSSCKSQPSDSVRLAEYTHASASRLGRIHSAFAANQYLQSFVSNDTTEVFRSQSSLGDREFSPPFSCAFNHAAKQGTSSAKKLLAVSNEEGVVSLLNAEKQTSEHDYDLLKTTLWPHKNAVFDVRWSLDDRQIATGSGDQAVILTDVETQTQTAQFAAHTCSVKQIAFDPHNPSLLSSASRDGSIAVWDQRTPAKHGVIPPVNHIRFAHDVYAKSRKLKDVTRSSTRSVTSVVYLTHAEHLLASAGSADGTIRLWDLRKSAARRINPSSVEDSQDFASIDMRSGKGRSYGVSSLALAPDGSKLYALSVGSKVTVHDPLFLSRGLSAPMHSFSTSSLVSSSFYVRLALSPCGRFLAAGSSGYAGETSIFDVSPPSARSLFEETRAANVVLRGHTAEVGGIDWAQGTLATCGDDNLIRMWRPNADVAKAASADKQAPERWHYSGAWQPKLVNRRLARASAGPPPTQAPPTEADAMECD